MIVFCTTCKKRVQHLEKTLQRNLEDNAGYPNCKFVILDYDSPDHLLEYLKSTYALPIKNGYLTVYSFRDPTPFKVAHAKNMAHRLGIIEGGDILVNLDADNFTGPGFAQFIADQFAKAKEDIFLWARMIQHGPDRLARGINGRLVVTAKEFMNVGGYDERFAVWSPDDKDFNLRLRRMGYLPREIDRQYLDAVRHSDKMRFKHHSTHEDYGDVCEETVDSADTTVVNYGKIGCGTVYKNFGLEPIELAPLPTRIFGIGMHKTATTSLHHALQILGYDSAHWKNAHWAKAIWEEMHAWGRSATLERHYALSDLPITLLYEKLDKQYPGSKFILTIRDEERWIQSVRHHWSKHNRFRSAWDNDPFSHRIHKALYGQKNFDEAIFRARYRRHNAEVRHYFQHRPDDLLIMDMESAGWPEICAFLRKPIPAADYPNSFVSWSASVPSVSTARSGLTESTIQHKKKTMQGRSKPMGLFNFNPDELATWKKAKHIRNRINGNPLFQQAKISIPEVTADATTSGIYVPTWAGGPAGFPEPAEDGEFWLHFRFSNSFSGMNVGLVVAEFEKYPASPLYVMGWILAQVQSVS
jgi:Sulfotransferase domain